MRMGASSYVAVSLLASTTMLGLGISSMTFAAPQCPEGSYGYEVEGYVNTANITDTTQVGSIYIIIKDEDTNDVVFEDTGSLVGNITNVSVSFPPPEYTPLISTQLFHTASFRGNNTFVTNNDLAEFNFIDDVRKVDIDGPCSHWVYEEITEIAGGNKFFSDVTEVMIVTNNGYISNCTDENQNEFDLYGYICFEESKK